MNIISYVKFELNNLNVTALINICLTMRDKKK